MGCLPSIFEALGSIPSYGKGEGEKKAFLIPFLQVLAAWVIVPSRGRGGTVRAVNSPACLSLGGQVSWVLGQGWAAIRLGWCEKAAAVSSELISPLWLHL